LATDLSMAIFDELVPAEKLKRFADDLTGRPRGARSRQAEPGIQVAKCRRARLPNHTCFTRRTRAQRETCLPVLLRKSFQCLSQPCCPTSQLIEGATRQSCISWSFSIQVRTSALCAGFPTHFFGFLATQSFRLFRVDFIFVDLFALTCVFQLPYIATEVLAGLFLRQVHAFMR